MRDHSVPNGLCSIDPISWTTIGVGLAGAAASAGAGALMGGGGGGAAQPQTLPQQQAPQASPTGGKKTNAPPTPSFIGGAPTAPVSNQGGKTLLGA